MSTNMWYLLNNVSYIGLEDKLLSILYMIRRRSNFSLPRINFISHHETVCQSIAVYYGDYINRILSCLKMQKCIGT